METIHFVFIYAVQGMFIVETRNDKYDPKICFCSKARRAYFFCRTAFTGNSCSPGFDLRADPTHDRPCGAKFRFPAQNLASRLKCRLAPVHHCWIPPLFVFLFSVAGETRGERCAIVHTVLAWRRNFPAQNGEKVTTPASVSKRSRRCKNGYRQVSPSPVAPNPRVVSKIRGKTGIS
jgi:hypothetical protein